MFPGSSQADTAVGGELPWLTGPCTCALLHLCARTRHRRHSGVLASVLMTQSSPLGMLGFECGHVLVQSPHSSEGRASRALGKGIGG